MKRGSKLLSCLAILFITSACSTNDDKLNVDIPDRYSPIYEQNKDARLHHISISENELIDVSYDAINAIRAPENANYDAGLGRMVVATKDSLLVISDDRKSIKTIDAETGRLLNRYSFQGRGPGEYEHITNLQVTDESVMIADRHLSIVNIYDRKWNLKNEIVLKKLDQRSSGSDILLWNSRLYYPSDSDSTHVINTSELSEPSPSPISFHKRIIPLGRAPLIYDYVMMDASGSGELLVSSPVSPFLFQYENHDLNELTYLDLPGLEKLHNLSASDVSSRLPNSTTSSEPTIHPPPVPFELDPQGVRFFPFLRDIVHTGDHIAFYYSNWHADLFFLTILGKDTNDRWEHQGSYRFYKESEEPFLVENLSYSKPWLYLSNHFEEEILRVNITELIRNYDHLSSQN